MNLLAGEVVHLTAYETLAGDTVGRRLAEMKLKPWQEKIGCIPHVNVEYVAHGRRPRSLRRSAGSARPVVGFDETPRQLIGEARVPIPAARGARQRVDYEYVRHGTANVFMFVDEHRPWRHANVTDERTCVDYAECMRDLVGRPEFHLTPKHASWLNMVEIEIGVMVTQRLDRRIPDRRH